MTLTKDYLEYLGIIEIKEDGTIYTKRGPLTPLNNTTGKYQRIHLYIPGKKGKYQDFYIHQIVWAWFNKVLPAGMEIHHIDFDPTNNAKDNLECLTHEEHKQKHASTREIKCRLDIPREWYVNKIKTTTGSTKSTYKCKLRYFDSHIEDYKKILKLKQEIEVLKYLKKHYKEIGDTRNWHQFRQLELNWETYEDSVREKIMEAINKKKH